jgi:hypothetical protein
VSNSMLTLVGLALVTHVSSAVEGE